MSITITVFLHGFALGELHFSLLSNWKEYDRADNFDQTAFYESLDTSQTEFCWVNIQMGNCRQDHTPPLNMKMNWNRFFRVRNYKALHEKRITCNYNELHAITKHYMQLQWITCNYKALHAIAMNYMELQSITCFSKALHEKCITCNYKALHVIVKHCM